MKLITFLIALSGLAKAFGLPLTPRSISSAPPPLLSASFAPTYWTILRLQRTCSPDLAQCTYSLLTLVSGGTTAASSCNVTVTSTSPTTQPATQLSLSRVPCKPSDPVANTDPAPSFTVSLGVRSGLVGLALLEGTGTAARGALYDFDEGLVHSDDGFSGSQTAEVRALEELQRRSWLWSGVERELGQQMAPVKAREEQTAQETALRSAAELENADTWSVENATRYYNSDFSTVIVQFTIFAEDYDSINCVVVAAVPTSADWKRFSFYSHNCLPEVPWHVSWGYNERRDSGVMTLMNPNRTCAAWFGWDNVNSHKQLDDVGPNDTQKVTPMTI
ncbi:hypothetical protein BROUX41_002097 [Berkeleyomyces rouxiae]|uniref:uncharacterized protein n=1 Tax=Berkeleyomyces rouxiae TaxID=2035830 RepID=UPI003B7B18AF